ncbi:MAG: ABC transporter substrate-binding protein, partial [Mycobacteriales bacterium]
MSWSPLQPILRRPGRGLPLAALAVALLAAGCSTKSDAGQTDTGGGLATGPGVTGQVIKLGVLTDRTGPFAAAGKALEQGRTMFWEDKNAHGGVCDRRVEFVVKDHGYNAQHAV